jgi:hypothetical protein
VRPRRGRPWRSIEMQALLPPSRSAAAPSSSPIPRSILQSNPCKLAVSRDVVSRAYVLGAASDPLSQVRILTGTLYSEMGLAYDPRA